MFQRRLVPIALFGIAIPSGVFAAPYPPLQYLTGASAQAQPVVWLTWGVLIVSVAVMIIIAGLLLAAVLRRHAPADPRLLMPDKGGYSWLWIGVGLSAFTLLATVVWTVVVLARIDAPRTQPRVTIEITGRQWWWQVRYLSADPAQIFATANEIHIPAGQPVRLKLVGGDVIHSFWVPQLSGKTDMIPGQTNEAWIEADAPGTYRGQCSEYCGPQHAHMGMLVVAQAPADFARWRARQLALPVAAESPGAEAFVTHCGGCHTVRGTDAAGTLGPDLSHLMARRTLAAGAMANDPESLARWISDPQGIKPGSLMPAPQMSDAEAAAIHAYLGQLQ